MYVILFCLQYSTVEDHSKFIVSVINVTLYFHSTAILCIGVTTMLNFFTTSNGFRSTLPVVSNLTAMNVWDGVCMCCIYASLLEFVLVNYVGRKRSDWPLPIVYQNKDQDYKQIAQVRVYIDEYIFSRTVCDISSK